VKATSVWLIAQWTAFAVNPIGIVVFYKRLEHFLDLVAFGCQIDFLLVFPRSLKCQI